MSTSPPHESQLTRALEEYASMVTAGKPPDEQTLRRMYPDIADELLSCLHEVQLIQELSGRNRLPSKAEGKEKLTIGGFLIQDEIGRGGMGVVYKGRRVADDRCVAVKILPLAARLDSQRLARFQNEIHAASLLKHDHIVRVLEAGCDLGIHFYAMEFIDGTTVANLIRQLRTPPTSSSTAAVLESTHNAQLRSVVADYHEHRTNYYHRIAVITAQAAKALEHAHQVGIIHRDIKPSNLLLDAQFHLWVADFGLAHIESGHDLTATGDLVGTLAYCSPEQALGKRSTLDHRADIYSLGATLYEMVTLRPALMATDRGDLVRKIVQFEPTAPRRLVNDVPVQLETIVRKAMEKEPSDRYSTAQELASDLENFVNGQPIRAKRPGAIHRIVRWSRRHKRLVTWATAAIVIVSTFIALISTQLAIRIKRAGDAAIAARTEAERSLTSLQIGQGVRLMKEGRLHESLAWLVEPLRRNQGTNNQSPIHRVRLEAVMKHCPRLVRFWRHESRVDRVSVSFDGTYLATAHEDGYARTWDIRTGNMIAEFRHRAAVKHIAFSQRDLRVVSASEDGTACIWNSETTQVICPPLVHADPVIHADLSPAGNRVLTVTGDGTIRLWNTNTGVAMGAEFKHELFVDLTLNRPIFASFSPDGRRILSVFLHGTARVWDSQTGQPITPYLRHDSPILDAHFDLDGNRIIVACGDRTVNYWDASDGRLLDRITNKADAESTIAALSPDRRAILTGNQDGSAQVSAIESGLTISSIGSRNNVTRDVAFGPDGHRVVIASLDGSIMIWELAAGVDAVATARFDGTIRDISFLPENRIAVSTTWGQEARIWVSDAATLLPTNAPKMLADKTRYLGHSDATTFATLAGNGSMGVTASHNHTAQLWTMRNSKPCLHPLQHKYSVRHADFSYDGNLLATASGKGEPVYSGEVSVWDTHSGQLVESASFRSMIKQVAFSPDGKQLGLAGSGYDQPFYLWNFEKNAAPVPLPHKGHGESIEFSPNGLLVATASSDQTTRVWDVQTLRPTIPPLRHLHPVRSLSFSPNGQLLVTGDADGTAIAWDVATGQAIAPSLEHGVSVRGVWFHPGGRQILTATSDGTLRNWYPFDDHLSQQDMVLAADIMSGHRVHSSGALTPISADELINALETLQSKSHSYFFPSKELLSGWHLQQAESCLDIDDFDSAIWHLTRSLNAVPSIRGYVQRASALAAMQQWDDAVLDYTNAIQLGSSGHSIRINRGRCLARTGLKLIVPPSSTWRWLHPTDGVDPAVTDDDFHTTFCKRSFNDDRWNVGADRPGANGGFGYGDSAAVDIGRPLTGYRYTAYFRHVFTAETELTDLFVSLRRDDGVIIYLDGREVARDNMSNSEEAYRLPAAGNAANTEDVLREIPLPGSLSKGQHILALSLHNRSSSSSDLRLGEISFFARDPAVELRALDDISLLADRSEAYEKFGWLKHAAADLRKAIDLCDENAIRIDLIQRLSRIGELEDRATKGTF